jgi:diguanylate cyclase (GGDEF)-like protein
MTARVGDGTGPYHIALRPPGDPPHIICVDDEEGILHVLRQQLAPFEEGYEVDLARSGPEALELLDQLDQDHEPVAMVIADQIMPGMMGVQLLEQVHSRHPRTAKILLTGQAGLDAVVHAINHAGLDRYIGKPWDEQDLRMTVETLLTKYCLERENQRLIGDLRSKNEELSQLNAELEMRVQARTSELAAVNERLAELAVTDGLTGCYNHRYFQERLALEVERSLRSNLPLSLLMIDVDHFKRYNDQHGHLAGDVALRRVAELLRADRRVNDVVARYGGEEFAVLLPDTPKGAAERVAESMRQAVFDEVLDQRVGRKVTISIGVAASPDDAAEGGALVHAADTALYVAKHAGRNRVVLAVAQTRAEER